MKSNKLGFIGGGRITKIFLQALQNKGFDLTSIVVCDNKPDTLQSLKQEFIKIHTIDNPSLAAEQDIVFVALHPPVITGVLDMIKDDIRKNTWIVSLAPKIDINRISTILNTKKILRVIPNAASYINEGYNPYSFGNDVDATEKMMMLELIEILGYSFEVPEGKLESYALLSAMLPTYFWPQWKTLLEIGVETGLTQKECEESIHKTLIAALNLLFNSGLDYTKVVDLIPVKPMAEHEAYFSEAYRNKLLSLFEKIKP
ncbi:MAG: NAD(P)-binding domain-containing protein [Bacteroidetes bacterium]|nr:NAD(P)-binding domain-containing protein [Bacteroidota bacterium]